METVEEQPTTTIAKPITIEYEKKQEKPILLEKPKQDDAKNFLDTAKEKLSHEHYTQFRHNLKLFRTNEMTADQLTESVLSLFVGPDKDILLKGNFNEISLELIIFVGFAQFLPAKHKAKYMSLAFPKKRVSSSFDVLHRSLDSQPKNSMDGPILEEKPEEEKKPKLTRSDSLVLLSEKIAKPNRKISDMLLGANTLHKPKSTVAKTTTTTTATAATSSVKKGCKIRKKI